MLKSHHTILVIDDDKLILNTLKGQFETWGTDIFPASTSEEAKDWLAKITPDLIVLDLLLTTGDGSTGILDYLQSQDRLRQVPIIVLTNMDKPELKQMLLQKGSIKEYLIKGNLNLEELHKIVWSYLEPVEKTINN